MDTSKKSSIHWIYSSSSIIKALYILLNIIFFSLLILKFKCFYLFIIYCLHSNIDKNDNIKNYLIVVHFEHFFQPFLYSTFFYFIFLLKKIFLNAVEYRETVRCVR